METRITKLSQFYFTITLNFCFFLGGEGISLLLHPFCWSEVFCHFLVGWLVGWFFTIITTEVLQTMSGVIYFVMSANNTKIETIGLNNTATGLIS